MSYQFDFYLSSFFKYANRISSALRDMATQVEGNIGWIHFVFSFKAAFALANRTMCSRYS